MPADPFDALRAPVVPMRPRRAFAADLRRRLARELGLDPLTGDPMSATPTYTDADRDAMAARHTVVPYICVADSRRAIEWYGEVLGAVLTYEPIVMDDGKIGHCELTFGDTIVQMADEFPELGVLAPTSSGGGVSFTITVPDVDATYALALSHGAVGVRPPEDQFYGARAGDFFDPFGHRWTVQTMLV
jgi:uncharacterized glyoxalase superfamily protein PhnB